jgi:Tol biopolymer transport system component
MKLLLGPILIFMLIGSANASANDATLEPLATGAPGILGSQGNRDASTFGQAVSADGQRVVFVTRSDNLDSADRDAIDDVYLADLADGTTRAVSSTAAIDPRAMITGLAISPDGRWIAWLLRRFVAGADEELATLRLHDTATEQTRTVLELERSGLSSVALSADAREIAFTTRAVLSDADIDPIEDVYVWTRADGSFRLASRRADGSRFGRIQIGAAVLTPNGRHLAFVTQYDAAIPGSRSAVQIVDLATGAHDEFGAPGDVALQIPLGALDLSADGRLVALATPVPLLPIDVNGGATDVYVFDRQARRFELVSVGSTGVIGNCTSDAPRISHDGGRVVFRSCADNFHPGGDGSFEIYVRDRLSGQTTLQTSPIDGQLPSGHQPPSGTMPGFWAEPSISGDGSHVVFASAAPGLVRGDGNRRADVFVVAHHSREIRRVGQRAAAPLPAGASRGALARDGVGKAFLSRDAGRVAFNVQADNLSSTRAHGALRRDLRSGVVVDALSDELDALPQRSIEVVEGMSDDGRTVLVRRTLAPRDPWDWPGFDPLVPYDLWLADPAGVRTRVDGHPDLGAQSRT